jgi:Predicted amidophosphoribosyltransferases
MKVKSAFSRLTELVFPPHCAFCGEVIPAGTQLCARCEAESPCIHAVKRIILPETGKTILCRVPYRYDGKVREAIIRFKFYGKTASAGFFGRQIAGEFEGGATGCDFITAVPISAPRKKRRGYNQSELIARSAAERMDLSYRETLVKTADNREQHRLSGEERRRNVRGVYAPVPGQEISGKRILLVDDIVTTGATLGECVSVLFLAGAKEVSCAAIAQVERL